MREATSALRLTGTLITAVVFAVASLACVSVALVFFLGIVLQNAKGLISILISYFGSCIGAAYCGAIALRIATILLPMRGDGTRRAGPIVLLGAFIATIHLAVGGILATLVDFAIEFGKTAGFSWHDQFAGLGAQLGVAITLLLYPHLFAMLVIPAFVLLKRHITPRLDQRLGSVLFLRRFDGKGDSAALAALYRARPKRVPLLFLIAPLGGWRIWDPYLIGLGSMRLPNLWSNAPFFLRSGESWEDDVEKRMKSASAIVIDITEVTAGVRRELNLLEAQNAWPRTIAIHCLGTQNIEVPEGKHALLGYAPRWSAARGRVLTSVLAAVSTTMILMTLLRGHVIWSPLVTGVMLLFLLTFYTCLFLRKLPDPEFTSSLQRALSEVTAPAKVSGKRASKRKL